jgi:ribosomal protein S18 acetylase RimI-like enzyme
MEEIHPVDATDAATLDQVVELIAAQQRQRERLIIYVGEEADGIRAELEALDPTWTDTVRVVDGERGPAALSLSEWDPQIARSWIFGPWVDGDDAAWDRWARPLVEAQLRLLPGAITSHELGGTVENDRLRRLADELGWPASEINHAYVLDGAAAGELVARTDHGLRGIVADDLGLVAPLHELEFPNTYFSAAQLVERASKGEHVVLVATTDDGHFAGYAAGRVQPDGIGYIDFVAVEPAARGAGAGRRLVTGLVRRLLPDAPKQEVHLTVQAHRAPARALYADLGFREDIGFVAYRSSAS